jgi:capsular polysaccharide biosynthesis protein
MSDPDQKVTDSGRKVSDADQTVTLRAVMTGGLRESVAAYEDPADFDDRPAAEPATGLVSLGFLWAALRRTARVWCILAVVGLLVGVAYYVKFPPPHKASTSVLLVDDPSQDPIYEAQTDVVLAESLPVAAAVIHQLGLNQTPSRFLQTYTVAATTNDVLLITAGAPTSSEAVQRAAAIATHFLAYRAQYERTQQQQATAGLQQQISQAQQHVNALTTQVSRLAAQPSTPAQQAQLTSLRAQLTSANNTLGQVHSYATSTLAASETVAQSMIRGSQVLNPALPLKNSSVKGVLIYGAGGLAAGLFVGLAIVIIGAITSDRLRRRNDIAYVIGAPVQLSVGRLRRSRVPKLGGRAGRQRDLDRIVEHLRQAALGSGSDALAVIAVDDDRTTAKAVAALATSSAEQLQRIVLADLSPGAPAARILGVDGPGIHKVKLPSGVVAVIVPAADDVAPVGPLQHGAAAGGRDQADDQLAAACADADLVLSLVTLNPSYGGANLRSWAADAVAVVTAGRSTATKIHAAGEMVRLAGTRLGSVVVVDADKSDESLGSLSTESDRAPALRA